MQLVIFGKKISVYDPNLYQIYEMKKDLPIGTATCAKIQTQMISMGWHW